MRRSLVPRKDRRRRAGKSKPRELRELLKPGPKRKTKRKRVARKELTPAPVAAPTPTAKSLRITDRVLAAARAKDRSKADRFPSASAEIVPPFTPYKPPKFVTDENVMAMDEGSGGQNILIVSQFANAFSGAGAYGQGYSFQGYQELSLLANVPEYRRISEVIATEMTRKWIKFQSKKSKKGPKSTDNEEDDPDDKNPDDILAGLINKDEVLPGENDDDEDYQGEEDDPEGAEVDTDPDAVEEEDEDDGEPDKAGGDLEDNATDDGTAAKIAELEDEFERLNVKMIFRKIAEMDGFFGRAHLFIDVGDAVTNDDRKELMTSIGNGNDNLADAKIKKGSLNAIRTVEPVWCYPSRYNSSNPLRADWYAPQSWFAMGYELHNSRLLTFVGREVPDLLKPAFSFGGLALSQMAKPYVDNWLRTRQSVADIIHAFSVFVLATDLGETLQADGDQLFRRADLFNRVRDNRGLMMLNKATEEFTNVAVPLGTLDALQAQTQEHMSAVSGIPLVKLLGIQPAGLNASSEGEIRTFYDSIHAFQEKFFRPHLRTIMHFAMMNIWGEVDPTITFEFEPLWSLDDKALADKRKTEADTDCAYLDHGVLSPEEIRARLAADPDSEYSGIDPDDAPEPEMPEPGNIHEREEVDENAPPGQGGEAPPGVPQKPQFAGSSRKKAAAKPPPPKGGGKNGPGEPKRPRGLK